MKLAYRSPLFFNQPGLYLKAWGKWYRIFK
jgi:hypothetical protein